MNKRSQGFTLLEILITVAIIAVLSAIAVPIMQNHIDRSKAAGAASAMASLQLKMEQWRSENPSYPTQEDFEAQLKKISTEDYEFTISDADENGYVLEASVDTFGDRCASITLKFDGESISRSPDSCFK